MTKELIPIQVWKLDEHNPISKATFVSSKDSEVEPEVVQRQLHRLGRRDLIVIDGRRKRPLLWT